MCSLFKRVITEHMKNKIGFITVLLAFLVQTACTHVATSSQVEDDFSDLELSDDTAGKSNLPAEATAALKVRDQNKAKNELTTVQNQINSVEQKIAAAQARLNHYQFLNSPAKESLVGSAQSEIISLENQKNKLLSRQTQLQSDLSRQ